MIKKKKILIATGGTGGHVFPAYGLANYLIKNNYSVKLITDNKRIIDHKVSSAVKGDEVDLTNYGFKNIKGIVDKVSKEVCWVKLDSLGCTLKLTLKK